MKKISKIEPKIPVQPKRKRVAAYVRVSRSTDRLLHSAAAQISYYNELIQNNPEWIFAGVYADTGISGLSTAARDEFTRLLADCDSGKIDILTAY
jgi:DNA invertase Pin-like site-specific DNA recombinase